MRRAVVLLLIAACSAVALAAGGYEIVMIQPVFSPDTPDFGAFTVRVQVRNTQAQPAEVAVTCLYLGLTHAGVYFKDEPQVVKQYQMVTLGPGESKTIVFDEGFAGYHPETLGELVVSVAGTGVVKSLPLQIKFPPGSQD
ncbi:MAG TPA: hypothetical protein PLN26_09870 [Acidobacteriota bacterium]|nr:hypothetical protein [Acidobacteriota bacterium]HQG92725.1 hypothetical protein [Acidobacteriota bacterium]HQK88405.1 hypothetical protein [Acidobacteriota bacterium]